MVLLVDHSRVNAGERVGLRGRIDACLLGLGYSSIAELSPADLVIPANFTWRLGG